jgi:hypothetical protein
MPVAVGLWRFIQGRRNPRQPVVAAGGGLNRSCKMDIIDIAILFDTQGILSAYPDRSLDFDAPRVITGNSIFLITESSRALGGLATNHLTIRNRPNEIIRWRSLALFGNGGHSASVYRIFRGSDERILEESSAFLSACTVVCPVQSVHGDEPRFTTSKGLDFYLESSVPGRDTHDYKIRFYITEQDRSSGEPKLAGYFEWRPTITFAGFE